MNKHGASVNPGLAVPGVGGKHLIGVCETISE